MSGPTRRYRPTFVTIEAFEYAGDFPPSFLCDGETVRKARAGSRSCVVTQPEGDEVVVSVGNYVVRDLSTNRIRSESAVDWFRKWEPEGHVDGS